MADWLDRHWRWLVLLWWLAVCGFLLVERWAAIRGFSLGDTDDNLRMLQVRALLEGQGWYDLRQYRLNPPDGANVHWSRLVDLPIAAIKLALTPFVGGRVAEMAAVAMAPLLPMLVAMLALGAAARRLVDPRAFLFAVALIVCAASTRGMWSPLRIDHHGWQLAMLAIVAMALVDPRRARGGAILGAATAASLTIGLEMLPYLALAGGVTGLRWIWDRDEARRLMAYGVALAGGCAIGYLLFASNDNRLAVCDALSPVWLSAMTLAGALSVLLGWANLEKVSWRLAAAIVGGALLAAAFALTWPDCLGRLEQSSPELERLWLSKVREAMPLYRHGTNTIVMVATLPIAGLIGYALMIAIHRRDPERLIAWLSVALPATVAALLLLWQTRAGPAAQLLSIPGATALAWTAMLWLSRQRLMVVRVFGIVGAFLAVSGLASSYLTTLIPSEPPNAVRRAANIANGRCPTLAALRPVARQPAGTVLTFVDLGPRLVTVTHHSAIAGPYHRNGAQIIDVMRTWRGTEENARRTVERYRIDYVLICPNLSESTIYRAEAPRGFYMQLMRNKVPDWMVPVPLPRGSPYRMWRVATPTGPGAAPQV